MLTSAAGKIYAAWLPINLTAHLIEQEWDEVFGGKADVGKFREDESRELKRRGYTTIVRLDLSGYVSITAPVLDWNGDVRFTLSQVIPELTLRFRGHISFLRQSSQRRVNHKSGLEGILLQRAAFRQIQLPQNPVSGLQINDQRRDFTRGGVDLVAFLPVI